MIAYRPTILAVVIGSVLCVAAVVRAADEIGIFFDPDAISTTWTTSAPNELVTAYLVLLDPSAVDPITGWECRLGWLTDGPDIIPIQWNLRGDAMNFGTAPDFIVGVGTPLPPAAHVVLMDFQVLVPSVADPTALFVQAFSAPSLAMPPGSNYPIYRPLYSSGALGDLTILVQTSGCESLPVAEINGPAAAFEISVDAPPLAILPFEQVNHTEFPVTNTGTSSLAALVEVSPSTDVLLAIDDQGWQAGPLWLHLEAGEVALLGVKILDESQSPVSCTITACGTVVHEMVVSTDGLAMAVEPEELDFGVTAVGVMVSRDATVTNRTRSPLNLEPADSCGPAWVPPGTIQVAPFSSTTFQVQFVPYVPGLDTCDIPLVWVLNEDHVVTLACRGFGTLLPQRIFDFEDATAGAILSDQYQHWGLRFRCAGAAAGTIVAEGADGFTAFGNSPVNAVHIGEAGGNVTVRFVYPDSQEPLPVHQVAFLVGDGDPESETVNITVRDSYGFVLHEESVTTDVAGHLFTYGTAVAQMTQITIALAPGSESTAFFDDFTVDDIESIATQTPGNDIPDSPRLVGNYPNPSNPHTMITFTLPAAAQAALRVYDVRGRLVRVLADGLCAAGRHDVIWDGRDDAGGEVASGVYLYRLETVGWRDSRRLVLVR